MIYNNTDDTSDKSLFRDNREIFFSKMRNNSIAFICSGNLSVRSNDTEYMPFRPNSNFFYLSGFNEPQAILVLSKKNDHNYSCMYLLAKDKEQEIWTGERLGTEDAPNRLMIDSSISIQNFTKDLSSLLTGNHCVYFDIFNTELHSKIISEIKKIEQTRRNNKITPTIFENINSILFETRLIKSTREINYIKSACNITKMAHIEAIKNSKNYSNEKNLKAIVEGVFAHNDTPCSYSTIVAAGRNALCLHYTQNNKEYNKNDLILIDAGCEYNCYASDVTRTFPANKKFTNEQKIIYSIVLEAQKEAIKFASKGKTLVDIHKLTSDILLDGLLEYKIIKNINRQEAIDTNILKKFYPHGTSHFMGIDVHDQNPSYINGKAVELEDGMIFTVEPGLYLYDNLDIEDKFKGIGIRIEDDILIQNGKSFNLTSEIPKEISDIESLQK